MVRILHRYLATPLNDYRRNGPGLFFGMVFVSIATAVLLIHQFIPGSVGVSALFNHAVSVAGAFLIGFIVVDRIRLKENVGRYWLLSFLGFCAGFFLIGLVGNHEEMAALHGQAMPWWTFFKFLPLWALLTYVLIQFRTALERTPVSGNQTNSKRSPEIVSLVFKIDGIARHFPIADITHISVDDHYCRINFNEAGKQGSVLVSLSLGQVLAKLPQETFLRVHRSYVVNINHVQRVTKIGRNHFVSIGEYRIPVSRSRSGEVVEKLNQSKF